MLDRDAILGGVDLRTLADELLGLRRGPERSPAWRCPTPTHAQTGRTPPVSVFFDRRGSQRWTCHGCGAGGTAIDLVMAVRGVGVRMALEELAAYTSQPGTLPAPLAPAPTSPDPEALAELDSYVRQCAARLWRGSGSRVRDWLTEGRGLPADVLVANLVGADPGPGLQARPRGVPRRSGAVFPVLAEGRAVYSQLRRLNPGPGQPRYLSVSGSLAPKPTVARYRPIERRAALLVATEGPVDALAAAAAGFDAVALLGAGAAGPMAAEALAAEGRPVAIAMDADEAGRAASARLTSLLAERRCRSTVVAVPPDAGDLAGWLAQANDWQATFLEAVLTARSVPRRPAAPVRAASRGASLDVL